MSAELFETPQEPREKTSTWANRIVTFCVTLITGAVMMIAGFIWNLRADFAKEQQKTDQMIVTISELKTSAGQTSSSVEDLKMKQVEQNGRLSNIENRLKLNASQ